MSSLGPGAPGGGYTVGNVRVRVRADLIAFSVGFKKRPTDTMMFVLYEETGSESDQFLYGKRTDGPWVCLSNGCDPKETPRQAWSRHTSKMKVAHEAVRPSGLDWIGAWFLIPETRRRSFIEWLEEMEVPFETLSMKTNIVHLPSSEAAHTPEASEELVGNEDGLLPETLDWRGDLGLD